MISDVFSPGADFTVVKNALAVFDCSRNKDGVYILDADPSIRCNEVCTLWCHLRCRVAVDGAVCSDLRAKCRPPHSLYACSALGIGCAQAGGVQQRMKPAAALSLVVYAAGIPLAYFYLLVKHRSAIVADQVLKLQGLGNTKTSNPNFHIRRRLQKLYVWLSQGGGRSRA